MQRLWKALILTALVSGWGWMLSDAQVFAQYGINCPPPAWLGPACVPHLGGGEGSVLAPQILDSPEGTLYTAEWSDACQQGVVPNCGAVLAPTVMYPFSQSENATSDCGLSAAACRPASCWSGGIDLLWMRPRFDQNVAFIIDPPIGNRSVPFDYDSSLAPRVWLGWERDCGSGVRAGYFRFDDVAETERATAIPGATPVYVFVYGASGNLTRNAYGDLGETLVANHSLRIESLDLEFTKRFAWGTLQGIAGVGLRWAELEQHMRTDGFQAGGILEEAVTNDLMLAGIGPTVSLDISNRLWGTPLGWYGRGRGAFLSMQSDQQIYEMKNAGLNELVDIAKQREVISNFELGVGLQMNHRLETGIELLFRAGYEAHLWFDVGGPVDTHSTTSLEGVVFSLGARY